MFGACVGRKPNETAILVKKQRQIDETINKRMKATKKEYNHTYRLLLLGSGESGKSTIVKQMQILHREGFTDEERHRKLSEINRNVLDSMLSILKAMDKLKPPINLLENDDDAKYIKLLENNLTFDFDDERFYDAIERLWRNETVQQAFRRSNEYQLIDCAKYFLDKIDSIRQKDYLPSDQDILRCRSQTTGIHQVKFVVEKVNFHLFDVGGQRYERRRWCQCFHGITAILFVTAMSDFNLTLAEDNNENRLRESVKLFSEVWSNRFLQGVSVILFLNKQDVLASKIVEQKFKIEDYFPEFKEYSNQRLSNAQIDTIQSTNHRATIIDDDFSVSQAKHFIRDLFVNAKNCSSSFNNLNNNVTRQFYAHYTCAVDTDNIRRIFNDVKNTIQIINLKNYELI